MKMLAHFSNNISCHEKRIALLTPAKNKKETQKKREEEKEKEIREQSLLNWGVGGGGGEIRGALKILRVKNYGGDLEK